MLPEGNILVEYCLEEQCSDHQDKKCITPMNLNIIDEFSHVCKLLKLMIAHKPATLPGAGLLDTFAEKREVKHLFHRQLSVIVL
jgi:hypothetical protein